MNIGRPERVHEIEVVPGFEPVPTYIPVEEPARMPDPEPVREPAYTPA